MAGLNSFRIGVLGGGSWGTALASLLASNGHDTILWAREASVVDGINQNHRNPLYLNRYSLCAKLQATKDLKEAVQEKQFIISVIPSHAVRTVIAKASPHLDSKAVVVSASKGIENETLMTMDQVLQETLARISRNHFCFLSGPSFAEEVIQQHPTAVTIAGHDSITTQQVQEIFFCDTFRTYTSPDVIGVELGGALKNVIAIAAGISDGMGFGHNSRAALITRGLSEIAQLGQKMGADPLTFLGLAGMGDLILTCTGDLSRNRHVGFQLGQGKTLKEILGKMNMVAEGVKTTKSVHNLAQKQQVEMVICEKVFEVLYQQADPRKIVPEIMTRTLRSEFHWMEDRARR